MNRKVSNVLGWSCGVALLLSSFSARADFLIEFLDGQTVTVGQYFEEKSVIKVYTPQGSIGFPKSEIKRILSVDEYRAGVPLETVSTKHPSDSSLETSSETPKSASGSEENIEAAKQKDEKTAKEEKNEKEEKLTYEEAGEKYQEVQQRHATLWEKHLQDVNQDAPEEVLEENRRQMKLLDEQRRELIEAGQEDNLGDLPEWAQ